MSQNNSTDRNTQRNTLLDNGYHPLPLAAKGCFIKGWSTREITAEWLQEYARIAKYPNTGIRCDNLIAFDIDVLDEQLADTIEGYIEARCGETEFCRIGRWPKRLLVYRAKGKGPYRKTCSDCASSRTSPEEYSCWPRSEA